MKHTRFEYIGPNGREITLYGDFEQSVQDDGQTLKVFGTEAVAGWRPIETAPKDGTRFIGWDGEEVFLCHSQKFYEKWPHQEGGPTFRHGWVGVYEYSIDQKRPIGWIPLPPAPEAEQ